MQTEPPRARPEMPEMPAPDTTVAALDPVPGDLPADAGAAPAAAETPAAPVAEAPPEIPEALPVPEPDPVAAAEPETVPEPEPALVAEPEPEPETESVAGLAPAVSPRARPRPPGLAERATIAAAVATVEAETAPDTLARAAAASRIQVQLGAYETPEMTRRMWQSVLGTHGDLLAGRALSVQSTVSGGKTWYRLRVGPFRDGAEARNICAALQARGQDCIVARNG